MCLCLLLAFQSVSLSVDRYAADVYSAIACARLTRIWWMSVCCGAYLEGFRGHNLTNAELDATRHAEMVPLFKDKCTH